VIESPKPLAGVSLVQLTPPFVDANNGAVPLLFEPTIQQSLELAHDTPLKALFE
jgi:hypothetical protein